MAKKNKVKITRREGVLDSAAAVQELIEVVIRLEFLMLKLIG